MSLLSISGAASQASAQNPFPGLIVRERDPENLEFPFFALNSSLTPNDQFFVRSHFPVPKIDLNSWSLKVEGMVEHPLEISFDQLSALPSRTVTMVMECAGNSRTSRKAIKTDKLTAFKQQYENASQPANTQYGWVWKPERGKKPAAPIGV